MTYSNFVSFFNIFHVVGIPHSVANCLLISRSFFTVGVRQNLYSCISILKLGIGHFRITFGLFFKASPGAHLFI